MRTFFEITNNKQYMDLTPAEKLELNERQNFLAVTYINTEDEILKYELFNELNASLLSTIKGTAARQARESSYGIEAEEYEGVMNLVLSEMLHYKGEGQREIYGQKLLPYVHGVSVHFRNLFTTNVRNVVKMMYRKDGYDIHRTTHNNQSRLDGVQGDSGKTLHELISNQAAIMEINVTDFNLTYFTIVDDLFPACELRKQILCMYFEGYKNAEIVQFVESKGRSKEAASKLVTRTWKAFREEYKKLT